MRKKQNNTNTSAAQITKAYAIILILITLLMSGSIITVVGYRLVTNKREEAQSLMRILKQSLVGDQPDWVRWRGETTFDTSNTFVKVKVDPPTRTQAVFYSPRTKGFLNENYHAWPLFKDVQYRSKQGVYYHIIDYDHASEGPNKKPEIKYEIWLSLNNMVHIFKTILETISLITIFSFLIGLWFISKLARRLNQPLVDLTKATHEINKAENITYHESLPISGNPQEVHELSIEFNRLLSSLNQQILREHQFVSDASHELRTPLAGVRGHISLIRRHGQAHPDIVPTSLDYIDSESLRMQHLIESLLQLSRMDHAELTLEYFNLSDLLAKICARYQQQIPQQLCLKILPTTIVYANCDSVEQIITALLDNAHKYSPTAATITLEVTTDPNDIAVKVFDEGNGISDQDKPHIFDRFYRADQSRSQKITGSGLGLAIAARLVDLNHGKIAVQDNVPHGSCFVVILKKTKP
ncbi:sensor histidine kinase [Loigolactobacillus coryniformis]|uniref:histidine kinase n=1 Tax=Loigolactobacillus coryniformis TaxID=1610 RepID=A0A5B8TDT2_9LACO|nr:HAMP domain-containing sensor histidine kinase [Loigolactobacillus coryniformis]QEA52480.1 HAMP domain-containing histidine kinase [Loigolactobacillus coryniformis]RRG05340.1 MAG: sensor histidine kinase [Lactobacillus sp.]